MIMYSMKNRYTFRDLLNIPRFNALIDSILNFKKRRKVCVIKDPKSTITNK